MQILFSSSDESPGINGLDIFKGKFQEFKNKLNLAKLTNIGFSKIDSSFDCDLDMYFVHTNSQPSLSLFDPVMFSIPQHNKR